MIVKDTKESEAFCRRVGLAIRARRVELGWTLEEVEARGYPSWRHLQKVEGGKNVTLATLYRVAKVLKIDPAELLKK